LEFNNEDLARYEQIALMVAREIAKGAYAEGQKVSGRSIIAGKYGVSPETVRKALSLLQDQQVVDVISGSGVVVLSRLSAQNFIRHFQEYGSLESLERRLTALTKQRNKLNAEIERVVKDIVKFKAGMLKSMQHAEEISLTPASPLIGQSMHEARLRTVTGVTIIAVRRNGRWLVSPGAEVHLQTGDILLAVGTRKAVNHLRRLATGKTITVKP
jgi:K+/H+ antiporter YhaU regulatory subunit KhtT